MKIQRYLLVFLALLSSSIQAEVFSIRPDWQQLTLQLINEKQIQDIVKDKKLIEDITKKVAEAEKKIGPAKIEDLKKIISSPEGQKLISEVKKNKDIFLTEVQNQIDKNLSKIQGLKCNSSTCSISPFTMQIGDKTLKADRFEVPYKNGKMDMLEGIGTNTVLIDPRLGQINLGTSKIKIDDKKSDVNLGIESSTFQYTQLDSQGNPQKLLNVPGGVKLQTTIGNNANSQVYNLDLKSNSGFTYQQSNKSNESITLNSSAPMSLSLQENKDTGSRKIFVGTKDPSSVLTFTQVKDNSKVVATAKGETYFLSDEGQGLFSSQNVVVQKDQSKGEISNLEIRNNGNLVSGNASKVQVDHGPHSLQLNDFKFAYDQQNQNTSIQVAKLSGRSGNTDVHGKNINLQSKGDLQTISWDQINLKQGNQQITNSQTLLEFQQKDKVVAGKVTSGETIYSNGTTQVVLKGLDGVFNIGDQKNFQGSLKDFQVKSSALNLNLEAINPQGVKEKFQLRILEKDGERLYQVFGENGNLIKIDASTDKYLVSAVTESIRYFESPQGQQIIIQNLSGKLKDSKNKDLAQFSFKSGQYFQGNGQEILVAQVGNVQKDGMKLTFDQLEIKKDAQTEFYKIDNSSLTYSVNRDLAQLTGLSGQLLKSGNNINGSAKFDNLSGNSGSAQYQIQNGQAQFNKSDSQNAGSVSFGQMNLSQNNQTLKITGAEVLYKEDNKGKVILGGTKSVNADIEGYKVNVVLKDGSQKDQKIQVQVVEQGTTRYYKLFNEQGQEISINAAKDKNSYQALFKNIEYITTPEFKSFIADNLSVNAKHNNIQANVKSQKIEFYETPLIKSGRIDGLEFKLSQNTLQTQGTLGQALFNQSSTKDEASISKGKINLVDKKLKGDVSFENALYQKLKEPGNELTLIRFDNTQLIAIEENVFKASANIGNANYLKNNNVTMIEINSLKDLKIEDLKNRLTGNVNASRLLHIKTKDQTGKDVSYYLMEGGGIDISSSQTSTLGQISLKLNDTFGELTQSGNNVNGTIKVGSASGKYQDANIQLNNAGAQFSNVGNQQNAKLSIDQLNVQKDIQSIRISGVEVQYGSTAQDKVIKGQASDLKGTIEGYKVDVVLKDGSQNDQKIQVQVIEQGNTKFYKLFNEKGQEISINAAKDKNTYQALFKNIEYLTTPEFKSFVADNLSVNAKHDNIQANIKTQKIEFHETPLIKSGKIDGLEFKLSQNSMQGQGSLGQVLFNQTSIKDEGSLAQGKINLVDKKLKGDVSFESAIYQKFKEPGNELTLLRFDNTQLVAIEEKVFKASANLGKVNYQAKNNTTVIEVNSIKDINIQDLKNKITATGSVNRLVQIKTKDTNGKPVSFYLLEGADIDISSPKMSVIGQISAKYLEVNQVGNRTVFSGDVKGSVQYQGPVNINASGSLQGKDLTVQSQKVSNPKLVSFYYSIESVTNDGGINHAKLEAGPDFLKDMISLEAKGNAGKKLDFTFVQDKAKGTYYLKAEFKEGDKIKVKFYPFTLESKKSGDSALIEMNVTPKGQNYLNHLDIISNVVNAHEITDFLGVSSGGLIVAKTPTLKGVGIEILYQNETVYNPGIIPQNGSPKAPTYGGGVFYESDSGSKTSVGVMLTGDSEYQYQTNGRGVLKVMGMNAPEQGRVPGTVNLYFKHQTAKGTTAYAGVSVDTTSYTVDKNKLDKDAAYLEGARDAGGIGVTIGVSTPVGDSSRISLVGGANKNLEDPAVCLTYEIQFGKTPVGNLADQMKAIEEFSSVPTNPYLNSMTSITRGPTAEGARQIREERMKFLSWEIDKMESAQELLSYVDLLAKKFDPEVVKKIDLWKNKNFLSKNEENQIKLFARSVTKDNFANVLNPLSVWRNKVSKNVDLSYLEKYKEELKKLKEG